jgi:hypothetical protein
MERPLKGGVSLLGRSSPALAREAAIMVVRTMSSIEEIEKAVANLPPRDLAIFSAWFEAFEAGRFDRQILQDAEAGKLDRLAETALAEFRKGPAGEI